MCQLWNHYLYLNVSKAKQIVNCSVIGCLLVKCIMGFKVDLTSCRLTKAFTKVLFRKGFLITCLLLRG